jgi:hypothetical protein
MWAPLLVLLLLVLLLVHGWPSRQRGTSGGCSKDAW